MFLLQTTLLHIPPTTKSTSPRFDIEKLNQYTLSCEISESSFSCEVIDSVDNQSVTAEKYNFPAVTEYIVITQYLESIYETHDFLKSLKWKSIEIIIDNQSFTLVPVDLYKKEYSSLYWQLAKGKLVSDDEEIHTYKHESLGIVNIYGSNRQLYNWLSNTYPLMDITFKHKTSHLIDFAVFSSKAQTALIYFGNHHFTMVITANGILKFCNRFVYKTSQDLVYYILFTMNELEIEPDEIFLKLCGNINEQSEDFQVINQYLNNVKISPFSH